MSTELKTLLNNPVNLTRFWGGDETRVQLTIDHSMGRYGIGNGVKSPVWFSLNRKQAEALAFDLLAFAIHAEEEE